MNSFQTISPSTEEILDQYFYDTDDQLQRKLEIAENFSAQWRRSTLLQRREVLQAWRQNLSREKENLAFLMALEIGKPIFDGRAEIDKCLKCIDYYVENFENVLRPKGIQGDYSQVEIHYEPMGILLAIMPWNYPAWQVIRAVVPALAAGNVILLKHSEICAGFAQKLTECLNVKGPHVSLLLSDHQQTENLIGSEKISMLTFTGSTVAAKKIASLAGKVLKKGIYECGGSDPYLVCEDADLDLAARICVNARMVNNGQSCIAAKRWIVQVNIYDKFTAKVKQEFLKLKIGDPFDEGTRIGPLAAKRFFLQHLNLVSSLKSKVWQAELSLPERGYFVKPGFYERTDEKTFSSLLEKEIFSPLALLSSAQDDKDFIGQANASPFALGTSVFSQDPLRVRANLLPFLQCGMLTINDQLRSDPRIPFGGLKDSGYGKELGPKAPLEFCNIKTVGQA